MAYNFNDPNWVDKYYSFLQSQNPGGDPDADPARWYNSVNNYRKPDEVSGYGLPVGISTFGPVTWSKEQIADPYNYLRHDLSSGWAGDYSQFGWSQKGQLVEAPNGYVYWQMQPLPAAMQNALAGQGDRLIDKIASIAIPALASAGFGTGISAALGAGTGATGGATGGWVSGEALPAGAMWGGADAAAAGAAGALPESYWSMLAQAAPEVVTDVASGLGTTATTTTAANGLTAKALMAMFPGMSVETANMLGLGSSILSPLASAATSGGGGDAAAAATGATPMGNWTWEDMLFNNYNNSNLFPLTSGPLGDQTVANLTGNSLFPWETITNTNYADQFSSWLNNNLSYSSPSSLWDNLNNVKSIGNLVKGLFGSNGSGAGGGLFSGLGGIGDYLSTAASLAPSLAAIAYATGQNPGDTSRLKSLYSQYSPEAETSQYDLNTDLGRGELTSSLARRGISGSSFGDQALTNYSTARDLGRNSLLNQGVTTQAGIANNIMAGDLANQKIKNDLYSGALLAMSGVLAPKKQNGLLSGLFG